LFATGIAVLPVGDTEMRPTGMAEVASSAPTLKGPKREQSAPALTRGILLYGYKI